MLHPHSRVAAVTLLFSPQCRVRCHRRMRNRRQSRPCWRRADRVAQFLDFSHSRRPARHSLPWGAWHWWALRWRMAAHSSSRWRKSSGTVSVSFPTSPF